MIVTLRFSGAQPGETVPTVALYLLDASGRVRQKLATSADGKLDIGRALELKTATVALGPDSADFHDLPAESLMQMRVADHLSAWERSQEIEILPPWWQGWNPFRICLGGRIRKCLLLRLAEPLRFPPPPHLPHPPPLCYPICNGIVEVWGRTCCCRPPIIIDLPDIIARIRQEIATNPVQFPPHDPGDPPPDWAATQRAMDNVAKARALGVAHSLTAPNTELAKDLHTLSSLPPAEALSYFIATPRLLPFWCHCSTGKIGETVLNPDGSFSFCYNRLPVLQLGFCSTVYFYKVRQWQDTQWVTIYDGGALHQYFTAGEFADLETYQGRTCGQNTPPPGTDFVAVQTIGSTGSWDLHSHYLGESGGVDLTQTGEFSVAAPPSEGGLVGSNNAPWATTLSFMLFFHPDMQAQGAVYYRLSVVAADSTGKPAGGATPAPITNPVSWLYFQLVGANWEIEAQVLGPTIQNGVPGLFAIPYNTQLWLSGQYHQSLDTTTLANGRYLLVLEIFDQNGTRLRPTGATGAGTDTPFRFLRLLQAPGPNSTASVPFAALTHLFWFDNRPCYGKIEDLDVNGIADTSVCQFLTGAASTQFQVGYRALHMVMADPIKPPSSFMSSYSISWHEGLNGPSGVLVTGGDTDQPSPPSVVGANVKTPPQPFSALLGSSAPGTRCTFTVNLDIYPKHTNGVSTIRAYEVHTEASFALEIV